MKYTLYKCNLCADFVQPSNATAKEGYALEYSTTSITGSTKINLYPLDEKNADCYTRHLCKACAHSINDAVKQILSLSE